MSRSSYCSITGAVVCALGLWIGPAVATPPAKNPGGASGPTQGPAGRNKTSPPSKSAPEKPTPQQKEVEERREGRVQLVRGLAGGEPQLTDEGGKHWLLAGAKRDELLQLGGCRLSVFGVPDGKKLLVPRLLVSRYEILDVGAGEKPLVGHLRKTDKGELKLEQKDQSAIDLSVPAGLARALNARIGCFIWIMGNLEGSTLKAYKFNWISCSEPKVLKPKKENK